MGQGYVGIDLHRRRTVIVIMDAGGEVQSTVRIDNDPFTLATEVAKAGPDADVVIEATYGWYWAVDVLQGLGVRVHLAHPLGLAWGNRRRKDDVTDARDLADLFRLGRLPEAWIAPPALRELREIVRHRAKLVSLRSGLKAQVHAVLAKEGVRVPMTDLFGVAGMALLETAELAPAYRYRVQSLQRLIKANTIEVRDAQRRIRQALDGHEGYEAVQAIGGVGETIGAIFVAEIGDISRFAGPSQLCSWAGLTPRHRESDTTVIRGRITKQGSKLVRYAAVEAAMRVRPGHPLHPEFERIAGRRGRRIARVAMARRIVELVYYGLRDHHIRFLDAPTDEGCPPSPEVPGLGRGQEPAARASCRPLPERDERLIEPAWPLPNHFMPPPAGRRVARNRDRFHPISRTEAARRPGRPQPSTHPVDARPAPAGPRAQPPPQRPS